MWKLYSYHSKQDLISRVNVFGIICIGYSTSIDLSTVFLCGKG